MKLTEAQQAAVSQRGSNLIVSASAGSGKTEVLARRCLDLVTDSKHPCSLDRLLVVTFTRAAAAELRSRVGKMLREAAQRETNRDLRQHVRRQQVLIDTAEIGTIDAWCARLVREHFAETTTGIDPGFEVLGAEQAALLRWEVAERFFDWVCSSDGELPQMARDWMGRSARPGSDVLREMVITLNRHRDHLVNPQAWFDAQRAAVTGKPAEMRAAAQRMLADALVTECAFQLDQFDSVVAAASEAKLQECLELYRDALSSWREAAEARDVLDRLAATISSWSFPRKPNKLPDRDKALHDEIKNRWFTNRIKSRFAVDPIARVIDNTAAAAELVRTLLALEQGFQTEIEREKHTRAVCEFGDVLRMALDLLGTPAVGQRRKPAAVARALRQRYEHILVDEYQDTSPVQVELLRLVTRAGPGCSNRFMVGDIKQSIYGFREAEPRLFGELINAFREGAEEGRVLLLADNFRSHTNLVAALNRVFAALFDDELGGTRFGEDEQLAARRVDVANPTLDGARIELHILAPDEERAADPADDESERDLALERIEREARLVATDIREMLNRGTQIPVRGDGDVIHLRPLRCADIAVLLRSARGHAPLLAAALRDAGIPAVAAGRESILDSREVHDVHNALSLIVNRRQDVPLAAYLRSPMVGLAAADLLAIRRVDANSAFHEAVIHYARNGRHAPLRQRLILALQQLDEWAAAARVLDIPALLQRVLQDAGYEHFAAALPGGEHRVAMLSALLALAVETTGHGPKGVEDFVAFLDDLAEQDIRPEASVAVTDDAVQIMTIHAAKGLEFPVVFVLNSGARFSQRPRRGPVQCDEQHGIGLEYLDFRARRHLATAAAGIIRHQNVQRELEEELRLLYVAATRAREKLVVVGHAARQRWENLCQQYADSTQPPPLIARLGAASMLDWLMMASASQGLDAAASAPGPLLRVVVHDDLPAVPARTPVGGSSTEPAQPVRGPDDQAWTEAARASLRARFDTRAAQRPAILSVSAVKEQVSRLAGGDAPRAFDPGATLQVPAFAADHDRHDGRRVGDAYHRFLQWTNLEVLASPAAILDEMSCLIAAGHLSGEAAALLSPEDVAWLGATALGQELIGQARNCRRETPFVCALDIPGWDEPPVLRGVIDCLFDTPDGIVLIDYKTDLVRDPRERKRREDAYATQMRLYSIAAQVVFGRPVVRGHLAYLRLHRMVDVPVDDAAQRVLLAHIAHADECHA